MSARILVVDDIAINVRLLHAKLTAEYFDVVTAEDGPSALAVMEADAPDIVLLDVMMPGMTGFEVCRRIKGDPRWSHIPVVMVTALDLPEDRVQGLECGADEFLTKPVNDLALFARVRSLVRLKRLTDEWRMRQETTHRLGTAATVPALAAERGDGAKIMLVAEEDRTIARVGDGLRRDQHEFLAVKPDGGVYDQVIENDVDLIILDLDLKAIDALRLASQIRSQERTRHLPLLILGRQSDTPRLIKGLELGINDYLLKPIDSNELLARVRTQIRRRRFQQRLLANHEASLAMALTDGLTGLFNRHYFSTHFEGLFRHAQEQGRPISVVMLDVDHFKSVNDTYGHAVGDQVLQELARRLSAGVRNFDLVARLGGEEFVLVMPETRLHEAEGAAERIRQQIARTPFQLASPKLDLPITVSIGIGGSEGPVDDTESMLRRADEALYQAKRTGRNRVVTQAAAPELIRAAGTG